jgi:alpha-tubulin suppressor-like RCC1 family protein
VVAWSAIEVALGDYHGCARRSSGAVVCWGGARMLGDGTETERATPVAVLDLDDAVELTAGAAHTCARRAAGTIVCWGSNRYGQMGDGTTDTWLVPAEVPLP